MKTVYTGSDGDPLLLVESVLQEQHIEYEVEEAGDQVRIVVADADEPRALETIRNAHSPKPVDGPRPVAQDGRPSDGNRRLWLIAACIVFPPLIPIAIGRALGGKVGVAIAAAFMALLGGAIGIVAGVQGDREASKLSFALAGVFAVLGPLEIFSRRTPPTPSR